MEKGRVKSYVQIIPRLLKSSLNPIPYLSDVSNCLCSTLPQILSIRQSCNFVLKGGNMASAELTRPFSWSNSDYNSVFLILKYPN